MTLIELISKMTERGISITFSKGQHPNVILAHVHKDKLGWEQYFNQKTFDPLHESTICKELQIAAERLNTNLNGTSNISDDKSKEKFWRI